MKLLPFIGREEKHRLNPVQIRAIKHILDDFPIFNSACPMAEQKGEKPEDCTFNGSKCKGCGIVRHVINQEVNTFAQLGKWTGERRYTERAKIFRSLYEVFEKGVFRKELE